jgi:hypothetical protein
MVDVDPTARPLPNADRGIVEERRVRDYLLNEGHAAGGPKARFFIACGFTSEAWVVLQRSLVMHGRGNFVSKSVETTWGTRYTGTCNCPTPDGRDPSIRTVWQMEGDIPRLLTAIPM